MQAEGRQFAQSGRDSAMRGGDLAFSYSQGYRLEWWRREAAVRWATVLLALVVVLVAEGGFGRRVQNHESDCMQMFDHFLGRRFDLGALPEPSRGR